ncbi:MAG: putative TonB-dependent outer membrane protein [Chlorobi bacterium]|nr:putative TonB-dependent outer membrane protein [Chlorobiota bacterium]
MAQETGTLTGTVLDASGGPLTGATIKIGAGGSSQEARVTRSDGRFVVTDIFAGDYSVEFSATGFTPARKTTRITAGQTSILNIRLIAVKKGKAQPKPETDDEEEDQSWVVPLDTPGGFATSPPIVDTTQPPIASLVDDRPSPVPPDAGIHRPAVRDAAAGGMAAPANDSTASRTTGEVAGLVIDDSGKPISGVRITLNDSKRKISAREGIFSLEDLPPGEYELTLAAKGYRPETRRITIKARWVVSLIVRMSLGGS